MTNETIRHDGKWREEEPPHVIYERTGKLVSARKGFGFLFNSRTEGYTSTKLEEINKLYGEVYLDFHDLKEEPEEFSSNGLRVFNELLWAGKGVYVIGNDIPRYDESLVIISPEAFIGRLEGFLEQEREKRKGREEVK